LIGSDSDTLGLLITLKAPQRGADHLTRRSKPARLNSIRDKFPELGR
jgi:hypothetical protein